MISFNQVQALLISKLKSAPEITSLLSDPLDIRELNWQGDRFQYPNIRLLISEFKRQPGDTTGCDLFSIDAHIFIFSDDTSSHRMNDIGTEILQLLDRKSFSDADVKMQGIRCSQSGPEWVQERENWRSEVSLSALVSKK